MDYVVTQCNVRTHRTDILLFTNDYNLTRDIVKLLEDKNKNRDYLYTIAQQINDSESEIILYKTPSVSADDKRQRAYELIAQQKDGLITLFEFVQEMKNLADRLPPSNPWLYD